MVNPYQSPNSEVEKKELTSGAVEDVASGQKLLIYAILLYFLGTFLQNILGPLGYVIVLLFVGMSWYGIYKISRGLAHPVWARVLLMLSMLIPLIGLIVLLVLNSRATSRLKQAGYTVGLLGARL